MDKLSYISEPNFRKLVKTESEIAKQQGKENIKNTEGFENHLIQVGNTAEQVAECILLNHPTLRGDVINPGIARVAGYGHDFSKIEFGNPYHDLFGAYIVLNRGEEMGLVKGGDSKQRKNSLIRIASCIPGDYCAAEELGNNFPRTAKYDFPEVIPGEFVKMVHSLRKKLSPNKELLDFGRLTSPDTLEKQITQYADIVDLGGGVKQAKERFDEIIERYREWAKDAKTESDAFYFNHQADVTEDSGFRARIFSTIGLVNQLAGF